MAVRQNPPSKLIAFRLPWKLYERLLRSQARKARVRRGVVTPPTMTEVIVEAIEAGLHRGAAKTDAP